MVKKVHPEFKLGLKTKLNNQTVNNAKPVIPYNTKQTTENAHGFPAKLYQSLLSFRRLS